MGVLSLEELDRAGKYQEMERERERREVTPDPASGFRPIDRDNIPPENTVVLVRYKANRPEVSLAETAYLGSKVDQHRVYPALVIYSRAPYSRTEKMFRGFMVLRARPEQGAVDGGEYMDGDVADAFDGWMPMPS
jgi:hypothetical protein